MFRTDVLAGASTFLAMAYIIVVNPAILKAAGLPVGASTVATILVAAVGSILMGVYANRPIAVAPYMPAAGARRNPHRHRCHRGGRSAPRPREGAALVPAFVTIAMMVFTFNIANGLTAGLVVHPIMKLLAGRPREIHSGSIVLAAACLVYYLFGLPH